MFRKQNYHWNYNRYFYTVHKPKRSNNLHNNFDLRNLYLRDLNIHCNILISEPDLDFVKPLSDQTVSEHFDVCLECETSKPGVKVTWLKDGEDITLDERFKVISDGTIQKLIIPDASLDDEAQYTCTVGDKTTQAVLFIEGK